MSVCVCVCACACVLVRLRVCGCACVLVRVRDERWTKRAGCSEQDKQRTDTFPGHPLATLTIMFWALLVLLVCQLVP